MSVLNGSKINVNIKDLAKVCADLTREGIIFIASCVDGEEYVIEFTGGF